MILLVIKLLPLAILLWLTGSLFELLHDRDDWLADYRLRHALACPGEDEAAWRQHVKARMWQITLAAWLLAAALLATL